MCECGRPKFECRNDANAGLYEVADVTCHAQAAIEERTGQKDFKPDPGQRFYAVEIDESVITRRSFAVPPSLDAPDGEHDKPGDSKPLQGH